MDPQQNTLPLDDLKQAAPAMEPSDNADAWIADLQALRRDYEAAEEHSEPPTCDPSTRTAAQNFRVYTMSPEEIEAVERMSTEEWVEWMCGVDMEALGVPIDNHLGLVPTSEQPPLELHFVEDVLKNQEPLFE